ncbi:MAG: thiamine pyrophosphate-dependent enzyme, partial [Thermomicrobiales bacterium]
MATSPNQGKTRRTAAKSSPTPSNGAGDHEQAAETQVFDTDKFLDIYRKMVEIRFFEDGATRGFRTGHIGGYLHVYSGQEAVATGFLDAYQEGDRIITAYRDHAHILLQGAEPNAVMDELFG